MTHRLTLILLILAAAAGAMAQTGPAAEEPQAPATIKGRVYDAETGESMPYTNVFMAGTNIGSMAFTDGFYIMRGLRPGTYTVRASYISYAVGSKTVTVGPGEVLNLDFELEVQAIMTETFEVAAERALIEEDRTGSAHFLSAEQMAAMPLDKVVDMISQQPGVTLQDNEIHIRGGRSDDTQFLVDGLNVSDPLSGGGYGYQIDPSIINEIEVLTGGFNAEYGQAVSGLVMLSTKEGSDRVEGRMSLTRDYFVKPVNKKDERGWEDLTNFTEPQNIDIFKTSLSGPDPITGGLRKLGVNLPGKQYMLGSLSMDIRDGYLPISSRQKSLESPVYPGSFWTPRQQNDWNGLLKWTWHLTPTRKLNLNFSRQVAVSQGFRLPGEGYPRPFIDNLDNYLVFTNENILGQVFYREVVSETSWFEMILGRNFNRQHVNVNGNDDFRTYEPRRYANDPYGQAFGTADRWHDHYTEAWTFKGTFSFSGVANNEFKTGLDMSFTEMQLIDLQTGLGNPEPGKLALREDIFKVNPVTGAAFFQDTMRFRGLVVNAGLRFDFWAPGKEVQQVLENPNDYLFITQDMADEFYDSTVPFAGLDWKVRLSPRIGLSFPVTERDKFFFNYGHFSQWPRALYVYPQLTAQTASEVQLLGNPNLDPKVTVEYETGIQHEFGGLWSMGLTFFNRDIYDYAKAVPLNPIEIGAEETPDPDDVSSVTINPVRYFNGDAARSLGIEVSAVKRTTRWLSGNASFELSRVTGTNSNADAAYLEAIYSENDTDNSSIGGLTRGPLIWDKPWRVSFNLDFSVFEDDRPRLFGWTMPANWSANLLARWEAGQRYKPAVYRGEGDVQFDDSYSALGPYKSSVNLRISKFWRVGDNERVTFYLEARNLLNHKDYRRVNPFTGKGYEVGDYNPTWTDDWAGYEYPDGRVFDGSTNSEEYAKGVVNPSYIENPRVFLWGVSYSW